MAFNWSTTITTGNKILSSNIIDIRSKIDTLDNTLVSCVTHNASVNSAPHYTGNRAYYSSNRSSDWTDYSSDYGDCSDCYSHRSHHIDGCSSYKGYSVCDGFDWN